MKVVAVVGSSLASERETKMANAVGRLLGEQGVAVVCGGRGGVMQAVCKGAKEAGGLAIGILPGSDPTQGNPYLSVTLPTGLGNARNALVVQAGSAVIAIGGGVGTLSEIALAIKYGRTVIGLETWQAQRADGKTTLPIFVADSPEHAVALALSETT
jgi:uncharacterized protein (TIGR00725 family)